ncbi:hypothetical protein NW765_003083 [Fusarium oxysporum]|nr:hypothetical protein NW765_003083 [Fusarium oxysporum]
MQSARDGQRKPRPRLDQTLRKKRTTQRRKQMLKLCLTSRATLEPWLMMLLLAERSVMGELRVYTAPPKRDRATMDAPQRREKHDRRAGKSHTMEEFVASELSSAPLAEPSIGTTIVQGGRKMKTDAERKEEAERRDYEEMNFTRLPKESKKDRAQKAKQAGRSNRMQFGGEDWHNLGEGVDRIDRLTKRKQSGGNVRALLDKSRKRGIDTTDGPRGSGMGGGIGERFNKRVKVLEGGRRDRGKGR